MKQRLLDYLACPLCEGHIKTAAISRREGDEIMEGGLACAACGRRFPVSRGIPRFVEGVHIEPDKAATAEKFGWEWQHFNHEDSLYSEQLLGWLAPVRPEFFRGKISA